MSPESLRICMVENHGDTAELLLLLLTQKGHRVVHATTCAQARTVLDQGGFDVLLSDIGLPDGNGWDLLAERDADSRPPCAIAMSGFGSPSDRRKSQAAGFQHHLLKPVALPELLRLLAAARQGCAEQAQAHAQAHQG